MLLPVVDDHLEFRKGLLARAILEFDPADNTNREAQLQDIRVVFVTITELRVVKVPGLDHLLLQEQTWRGLSDRRPDKEKRGDRKLVEDIANKHVSAKCSHLCGLNGHTL